MNYRPRGQRTTDERGIAMIAALGLALLSLGVITAGIIFYRGYLANVDAQLAADAALDVYDGVQAASDDFERQREEIAKRNEDEQMQPSPFPERPQDDLSELPPEQSSIPTPSLGSGMPIAPDEPRGEDDDKAIEDSTDLVVVGDDPILPVITPPSDSLPPATSEPVIESEPEFAPASVICGGAGGWYGTDLACLENSEFTQPDNYALTTELLCDVGMPSYDSTQACLNECDSLPLLDVDPCQDACYATYLDALSAYNRICLGL